MWVHRKLDWAEPLAVADTISDEHESWVLFYSCYENEYTGQRSILAFSKEKEIKSENFEEIKNSLSGDKTPYEDNWFGYLGYGLKNSIEKLSGDKKGFIDSPNLWLTQYNIVFEFDHINKIIHAWAASEELLDKLPESYVIKVSDSDFATKNLFSNMSKSEYLSKVEEIIDSINKGDLYQANLTRKFCGKLEGKYDSFEIFKELVKISPSPYSAFIKNGDLSILSSSPERFLNITYDGSVETRPIKGSAGRSEDKEEDYRLLTELENSEKDKAENLMIVDLMRNDLSRSCKPSSVKVGKLFEITSYATVHHMSSTVTGIKSAESSTLDVVKSCFPPGSMTGAPKIMAMETCSRLEDVERGIYSGAIGWFGGDGSSDLSVVIRTITIQGDKFEFQVGGGIVADSKPENEYEETLVKAKAISEVLGLSKEDLENI